MLHTLRLKCERKLVFRLDLFTLDNFLVVVIAIFVLPSIWDYWIKQTITVVQTERLFIPTLIFSL